MLDGEGFAVTQSVKRINSELVNLDHLMFIVTENIVMMQTLRSEIRQKKFHEK